jgi:hypothetical protein
MDNKSETKAERKHISLEERFKNYPNWDGKPYELTEEDLAWINMEPVGKERFWLDP